MMGHGEAPIRIMYVVWSLYPGGGAEKLVFDMIHHLPPGRFQTTICSVEHDGVLGDLLRGEGYAVFHRRSKAGIDPGMIRWLRDIIKCKRIEVIHAHQYNALVVSALATLDLRGVKLIYTEHGRNYPERRHWKRYLINPFLALRINHMLTISESTREAMAHFDNFPKRRIGVIHNGIDHRLIPTDVDVAVKRHELGIPEGWQVVGTAARLESIKNIPMMLSAFRLILDQRPETCLLIAGSGSLEGKLRELCAELGVAAKVRFLGLRQDLLEIFSVTDIFLLSSLTEGISVTLLEAMGCGVPAVVTNVGGNPDVVQHGVSGFLVPTGSPELMAQQVLALLADPLRAAEMGRKGKELVESRFSFEQMMGRYLALYDAKRGQTPVIARQSALTQG